MAVMHAELVKLGRSALPWVVAGLCGLFDVFLFAVYTAKGSSVFEPDLLRPGQVASLLLASFIAIANVFPAVLVGCHVGARDYADRTAGTGVHWAGRYAPLAGKILATVVALCGFVLATGAFGLLLGLAHDPDLSRVEALRLLQQLGVGMIATGLLGVLALTVATLARSAAAASLITLVALLGQMFLPSDLGQAARFINPLSLLGWAAGSSFSNLDGLRYFAVNLGSELDTTASVVGLVVYLCCCLATLALVARFREYR